MASDEGRVTPNALVPPSAKGALPPQVDRSYRPHRERHHNEVEITFYCSRDRLGEMMQYRHVFGDRDFTRSLSRFLTAGCHWMDEHQAEVGVAQAMATEVKLLEQQRDALRETIARLALPRGKNVTRAKRSWWRRLIK